MDDVQVGAVFRAVRLRRGLSQSDVAAVAGLSTSTVSLLERGALEEATLRIIRRVAAAVGVSLPFRPQWRGADLAKLLDERHARICSGVAARLAALGWIAHPEFTFNYRGERGSIDILAWYPGTRTLLVIEVKTAIVDLQDLFSVMNMKLRLAPMLASSLGWRPSSVASVLVVPDESWARRAVRAFGPLFDAALPARTVAIRRWIANPTGALRGVWFLADCDGIGVGRKRRATGRPRRRPRAPARCSGRGESGCYRPESARTVTMRPCGLGPITMGAQFARNEPWPGPALPGRTVAGRRRPPRRSARSGEARIRAQTQRKRPFGRGTERPRGRDSNEVAGRGRRPGNC